MKKDPSCKYLLKMDIYLPFQKVSIENHEKVELCSDYEIPDKFLSHRMILVNKI